MWWVELGKEGLSGAPRADFRESPWGRGKILSAIHLRPVQGKQEALRTWPEKQGQATAQRKGAA